MNRMFPNWGWDVSTPSLVYLLDRFHHSALQMAELCNDRGIMCCYAVKANRHSRILAAAAEEGLGFDVASFEEFQAVRALDIANPIMATSPGLTKATMAAVDEVHGTVFFDNHTQISLAREVGLDVLDHGIRLAMPGDYASFGFASNEIGELSKNGFSVKKIHVHAGEYIDQKNVERRLQHIHSVVGELELEVINLGGGFGILSNDRDCIEMALSTMKQFSLDIGAKLIIEPGKAIAARSGFLVATVLASKGRLDGQVVVIDSSSFNLGEMEVRQLAATSVQGAPSLQTTIIGPTCFEGDIWGCFHLPQLIPGDRLIFSNMGAYTKSIAANLHGLAAPKECFIE